MCDQSAAAAKIQMQAKIENINHCWRYPSGLLRGHCHLLKTKFDGLRYGKFNLFSL